MKKRLITYGNSEKYFIENHSLTRYFSIIMEYADNGDLFQLITSHKKKRVYIDEKEVWSVAIQMLKGKNIYKI